MLAHIAGVPVEEALPALMSGLGAALLLRLTLFASRFRRRP
jgi:hypothetical protein